MAELGPAIEDEARSRLGTVEADAFCGPLLAHRERLPAPQRDAIATAFGLSAGGSPDRFFVGLGVLGLLSEPAIAGVLPVMRQPSSAAIPIDETFHQDFTDISSSSLFVSPRPVWSGSHPMNCMNAMKVLLMETNAVPASPQCEGISEGTKAWQRP